MSPGFGAETGKFRFSDIFTVCSHLCWSVGLQVAPGGVELRSRRSQEVRRSPELQNGSLRALEETSMMTARLRHFPVNFERFLEF